MSAPVAKKAHKRLLEERSASFSPADRLNSALILRNSGDLSAAFRICRSVLQESNGCADAWHLLGVLTLDGGDPESAAMYFLRALKLNPRKPQYYNSLAVSLIDLHRFQQAETTLMQAAALFPPHADILCNLGRIRMVQERFAEALDLLRKALKIAPDHAVSIANMAVIDQSCGRERRAVEAYRHALRIDPHKPIWWSNMGAAFMKLSEYVSAADCFHNALKCAPDHLPALSGLSMAQRAQGAMEQSAATSRRILLSHPQNPEATANLAYVYQQTADWVRFEAILPQLSRQTSSALRQGGVPAEAPFFNLGRTDDSDLNLAVSRAWSRSIAGRVRRTAKIFTHTPRSRSADGRITLGYLSSDFRNHVIAYQAVALFELHDRKHFRVCGFSTGPDDRSAYRRRISASFDTFCDLREADAAGAAQTIYEQNVDILIDLTGHTEHGRQDICALRPAPLQISYLGFLSSSGADYIDYLIGDPIVTPAEHARFYTEKLIRLPHCYQIISPAPPFPRPVTRAEAGLPEHAFVFCCFNQAYKIDARLFDCWMKILRKVPAGVLWLYRSSETAERNLRRAAAESGIARERIIFADKRPFAEHMQRARLADLALDPTRYNGGATTANMLSAGVPVVTINGNHFVSRMSASHLIAAGLGELVASDPDRYIQLAVDLAASPERLNRLRRLLSSNLKTSPLCDTPRWVKHLEQAYEEAWERHCRGRAPDHIDIHPIAKGRNLYSPKSAEYADCNTGSEEKRQHPAGTRHGASDPVLLEAGQASSAVACDIMDLHKSRSQTAPQTADLARAAAVLIRNGKLAAAATLYRKLLILTPGNADLHHLLGMILNEQSDWNHAIEHFQHAIRIDSRNHIYFRSLGDALTGRGEFEAACELYIRSLAMKPRDGDTLINLGNVHYELHQTQQALNCYARALEIDPENKIALNNMGKISYDMRRVRQALKWFERALAVDPAYAEAGFNRALALLLDGDYQQGWQEYEWRFQRRNAVGVYPHRLGGPRWDGKPFTGKRLLVHCEQGLGDVIQFARFLPQVKSLGGTLILEVQPSLITFLKSMGAIDRIVAFAPRRPPSVAYDLHVPLLSLPRLLGTSVQSIPADIPYLRADPGQVSRWNAEIPSGGLRIGLIWSCSNPRSYRESRLETFLPLMNLPGVHCISLQKGEGARQVIDLPANQRLIHLGDRLHDFSDTAAVIANLDLIISVDTAVVHVAGAMGVPVWVLVPFAGDWRWLRDREDSPWYPSARLFRQAVPGDWTSVITRVARALRELTGKQKGF